MSERLLVRISAHPDAVPSWTVVDQFGQLLALPSSETGIALQTMAQGRRVALLVPAGEVSLLSVQLPAGNDARLQQLAPFALEDQLSQDIDSLHFAVGTRNAVTGQVPVAVVERDVLTTWLQRAADLHLTPDALYVESELAPALPGHVTMTVIGDQLTLRMDSQLPVTLPADDPDLALQVLLGTEADTGQIHVQAHATPGDWQRHGAAIEALRDKVASFTVQLSSGGVLAMLATGLAQATPINLAQGAFKPHTASTFTWQRWRWVAALAGSLFLLHGLAQTLQVRRLAKTEAAVAAATDTLWSSTMPGVPRGADPRRAMEQRVAALSGSAGQHGDLMHLLAAVAAARENVPVVSLQSLNFKSGGMQLKLSAPDASTLEQFSAALRAGGYTATVSSGSVAGPAYVGQIDLGI
jgi:general secretion pathway protein L